MHQGANRIRKTSTPRHDRLFPARRTRPATEWLGVDHDRGAIVVGMGANLLMLDAEPLSDISNTRGIAAVIRNGSYLGLKELSGLLGDPAEQNGN